jgi:predicted transcriptional regulator
MVRISVELPEEVAEALGRLASAQSSTPEAELARIASRAVAARIELQRRLDEGLADLAAGRTSSNDEVMAELDAWVEEVEARQRGDA